MQAGDRGRRARGGRDAPLSLRTCMQEGPPVPMADHGGGSHLPVCAFKSIPAGEASASKTGSSVPEKLKPSPGSHGLRSGSVLGFSSSFSVFPAADATFIPPRASPAPEASGVDGPPRVQVPARVLQVRPRPRSPRPVEPLRAWGGVSRKRFHQNKCLAAGTPLFTFIPLFMGYSGKLTWSVGWVTWQRFHYLYAVNVLINN